MTHTFSRFVVLLAGACLVSCHSFELAGTTDHQYMMNDSTQHEIDSAIYRMADPYRSQLMKTMGEIICNTSSPLEKGNPEGALGNFAADVCLEMSNRILSTQQQSKADVAILNNGGLRKSLPQGSVTLSDIFEVFPFENQVVVLTCNGTLVKRIFDFIAVNNGTPISGASFQINRNDHSAETILIGGLPLDTARNYRVVTVDYLANGGDRFTDFATASKREELNIKLRDIMIEYTREQGRTGKVIVPAPSGRIAYVQ